MINALSILCLTLFVLISILVIKVRKLKKELYERYEEANILKRQRNELVANVSHDLKTPLTSIKGFAETLITGDIPNAEIAQKFYERISHSADHMLEIIQDNLDLLKLEATNAQLKIRKISLDSFFEELTQNFSFLLDRQNQSLVIENSVKTMLADESLLRRAFSNLIENAERYCEDGAQIKIRGSHVTLAGTNWIQFQISDNGPGIPKEDITRIFERYYRGEKSRDRKLGGTGLGLAIVKHIMISHAGQVRVNSEIGKGTTFTLLFPE